MLKTALRTLAIAAAALTLTGCGGWVPAALEAYGKASTTEVRVTKADAQKVLADIQKGRAIYTRAQIAYLEQTPCGTKGAFAPPFCASVKVGDQMKKYDDELNVTMARLQNDVETLGDNPKALAVAKAAAETAWAAYKGIVSANAAHLVKEG